MFRIQTKQKNDQPNFKSLGKQRLLNLWQNKTSRTWVLSLLVVVASYFIWTHGNLLPSGYRARVLEAQASSPLPPEWQERYFGKNYCSRANYCGPDADPDRDGLSNYEEFLFFTNPTDPDTDKDGSQDGEEVKNLTNPLGSGLASNPRDINDVYEYNPFADQLIEEGLAEIEAGNVMTIDQIQIAASQLDALPEFYEIPFKVNYNNNQAAVDQYTSSLVLATQKYQADEAVQTGSTIFDSTDISLLDRYIEATRLYATTLVYLDTPLDLYKFHKSLYGSLVFQGLMAETQKKAVQGEIDETELQTRIRALTVYYTRSLQDMSKESQVIRTNYSFPFNLEAN